MSRSVDQRIVEMRFDNAQFERGAKETMSLLDKLKNALNLGGAKDVGSEFSMQGIISGVDSVTESFSALGAIGFSVLQDLTQRAIALGGQMISAVTAPVLEGGRTRALNMEQANFQFEGLGMDVEATMDNALAAVKGTAYGLDEAAVLAANFGATGMEAGQEMEDALRGVSGVAAMAGASYSDIGQIFGTVAGQGRLMGNDLNRLAARGVNAAATMADQMGITEAEFREMVSAGEISFEMFAEGMNEAFGDHATKANETYTGSLSNMRAALSRLGAMYFVDHLTRMRDLFNATTPLIDRVAEGLEPLIDRLSDFLNLRFEGFTDFLGMLDDDATGGLIMDKFVNAVTAGVDTVMTYLGPVKDAFQDIFGGSISVAGVANFFSAIERILVGLQLSEEAGANLQRTFAGVFAVFDTAGYIIWEVVKMIGRLVGTIFDGTDGFLEFTGGVGDSLVAFRDFIKEGTVVETVLGAIEGVLSTVIGWFTSGVSAVAGFFGGLFSGMGGMNFDWLTSLGTTMAASLGPIKSLGGAAVAVWGFLGDALSRVWDILQPLASSLVDWLSGIGTAISDAMRGADWSLVLDAINTGLFAGIFILLRNFFGDLKSAAEGGGLMDSITGVFSGLTTTLSDMQNTLKAGTLLAIAGAIALLAGSLTVLSMIDPAKLTTALVAIAGLFGQLMGGMAIFAKIASGPGMIQLPLLAGSLILVAGALALLTVPLIALSFLDWNGIAKGLAALAGMFALIIPSAWALQAMSGSFIRIGIALIPFAAGLGILAAVIRSMSSMSWDEIGRGLTTLAGALVVIAGAMWLIPDKAILRKAGAMAAVAVAMRLLVDPLQRMGGMGWEEIAKGLTTLAGSLLILAGGLFLMSGTTGGSVALTIAAAALNLFIGPLERMSSLGWDEIGKGLATLGGSLALLAAGLFAMSFGIAGSAALLVASAALMMFIDPLERMGRMGWDNIGKALATLGGSLALLSAGLFAMTFGLAGALVLPIAAAGLALLTPVLYALGGLSWGEIARGLSAIAGTLALLAIAGALMVPALPGLLGLGAALILIGGAMTLAGVGMLAFGTGLAAVGVALATNGALLVTFIEDLIDLLPRMAIAMAESIADFVSALAGGIVAIVEGIVEIGLAILDGIRQLIPETIAVVGEIISALITEVNERIPEVRVLMVTLIREGIIGWYEVKDDVSAFVSDFIQWLLQDLGSDENIAMVVQEGVRIITTLLNEMGGAVTGFYGLGTLFMGGTGLAGGMLASAGLVTGAGGALSLAGIRGALSERDGYDTEGQAAGDSYTKGIARKNSLARESGKGLSQSAIEGAYQQGVKGTGWGVVARDSAGNMDQGFLESQSMINTSGQNLMGTAVDGADSRKGDFKQPGEDGASLLSDSIYGGRSDARSSGRDVMEAGVEGADSRVGRFESVGSSAGSGINRGLRGWIDTVRSSAVSMITRAVNAAKNAAKINSPSRVFMEIGEFMGEGVAEGMDHLGGRIADSSAGMIEQAYDPVREAINILSESVGSEMDLNPTIRPVLDLSEVEERAGELSSLLNAGTYGAYSRARAVASSAREQDRAATTQSERPNNVFNYSQNITSPEPVSTIDIYRHTKNQLSRVQEGVENYANTA